MFLGRASRPASRRRRRWFTPRNNHVIYRKTAGGNIPADKVEIAPLSLTRSRPPSLPPLLRPSLLLASVAGMTPARGQGARRASELAGLPRWKRGFLDEGNWRKKSYGVPPRSAADECGALGRRELVGAIALTDHSAVARFEEERAALGRNRAQRVSGRMISNWRAVGRSGPLYYLHLRPLRAGKTVRA